MSESKAPASPRSLSPIKKLLTDAGMEIFRTRGDEIVLAERPRENLILDSGVRLFVGDPWEVRVVLRAQKADFPNEDDAILFGRVRHLATPISSQGFVETGSDVTRVPDPGDDHRTLDLFYEIVFARPVASADDALDTLRFALGVEKRAQSTTGAPA